MRTTIQRWVGLDMLVILVAALVVFALLSVGETTAVGPAGRDTLGLVDITTGQWNLVSEDDLVTSFIFGNPGDLPVAGDWNGNGTTTPGLYRQADGFWYGRNSNTQGIADFSCFAGDPSDLAVRGDWDNDGDENLGIYRPSEQKFFLFTSSCKNAPMGAAQISFLFGNPGDLPYSGDFDGDGVTEIGLFRPSTGFVYYRNTLDTGNADNSFFWGDPSDRIFSGDWTANGTDTPGLFRPAAVTSFFRNTNTQGNADSTLAFGQSHWIPVSGKWGLTGGVPPTTSTTIGGGTTTTTTTTMGCPADECVDTVGNTGFSPANFSIPSGGSVRFTSTSSTHNIKSGTSPTADSDWATGNLSSGSSGTVSPTSSGDYFCSIHPAMQGHITVTP